MPKKVIYTKKSNLFERGFNKLCGIPSQKKSEIRITHSYFGTGKGANGNIADSKYKTLDSITKA